MPSVSHVARPRLARALPALALPALVALGLTCATLVPPPALAGQGAKSNSVPTLAPGSPTNSVRPQAATGTRKPRAADPAPPTNRRGSASPARPATSRDAVARPPASPATTKSRPNSSLAGTIAYGITTPLPQVPTLTVSAPPAEGNVRLADALEPATDAHSRLRNTVWDGDNATLVPLVGDDSPTHPGAANETESAFRQLGLALDREDFLAVYGPLRLGDLDQPRTRFSSDTFLSEWQYSIALRSRTNYTLQALRTASPANPQPTP